MLRRPDGTEEVAQAVLPRAAAIDAIFSETDVKVTLSFDNGPEPGVTDHVLDVLGRAGLRSTFFVIGRKLADPARRARAERARAEGHWIGNHSLTHSQPFGRREDRDGAEEEIGSTQRMIGALAHPDRLFRPFGGGGALDSGLLNRKVVDYLCAGGFTCVLWNCVPRDWEDPSGWAGRALEQCRARAWSVVVLHDLPTGAMLNLEAFIADLRDAEAEIVQEFPPGCMPIVRGRVMSRLDPYVAA